MDADKIGLGDDETQRRAVELHRQLATAYTLEMGPEFIGQVTGDVLAEVRSDRELCAAFLYAVGVSFKALAEQVAEANGVTTNDFLSAAFLAYDDEM